MTSFSARAWTRTVANIIVKALWSGYGVFLIQNWINSDEAPKRRKFIQWLGTWTMRTQAWTFLAKCVSSGWKTPFYLRHSCITVRAAQIILHPFNIRCINFARLPSAFCSFYACRHMHTIPPLVVETWACQCGDHRQLWETLSFLWALLR